MKTKIILLIFGLAIAISSCAYIIKSLHPFYKQKDIIFNKDILGTWIDSDSSIWIFNQHKFKESYTDIDEVKSDTYELIVKDSADGDSYFNVCLFTIKGETYLDFFPIMGKLSENKLSDWHMIPVHSLAKLRIWADRNITFFWYSEEWFNDLRKKNKLKVSYETIKTGDKEDEVMNILTASTDNLQKFIVKFGKESFYDSIDINLINNLNDPEKKMEHIQEELEKKEDVPFPAGIKNAMVVNLRKINIDKND
jgi:hypothetical protein